MAINLTTGLYEPGCDAEQRAREFVKGEMYSWLPEWISEQIDRGADAIVVR